MRKFRFRPKLRDTVKATMAHLSAFGAIPPDLQASHDKLIAGLPKQRGPIVNRSAPDELEGSVSTDVGAMLRDHPQVLIAMRFNSGSIQRQTASGDFVPMWFHRWISRPEKMRLTDYFGWLADFRPFALECKRANWRGPSDDRELEQQKFIWFIRRAGGVGGFVRSGNEAKGVIESGKD